MPKIMLVDDHPLFLEGMVYLLKTYGYEVSYIANCGSEAIQKANKFTPDIILMDIKMHDLSGIDTLKIIKSNHPNIKIAMMTSSEDDQDLIDAIRSGASGYILKSTGAKELIEMLRGLEKGESLLSPPIAKQLLLDIQKQNGTFSESKSNFVEDYLHMPKLTARQLEILEMVAKGTTYKDVAVDLGLTERTVKYHMEKIIEQLHQDNRSQAISYAVRMGIIDGDA